MKSIKSYFYEKRKNRDIDNLLYAIESIPSECSSFSSHEPYNYRLTRKNYDSHEPYLPKLIRGSNKSPAYDINESVRKVKNYPELDITIHLINAEKKTMNELQRNYVSHIKNLVNSKGLVKVEKDCSDARYLFDNTERHIMKNTNVSHFIDNLTGCYSNTSASNISLGSSGYDFFNLRGTVYDYSTYSNRPFYLKLLGNIMNYTISDKKTDTEIKFKTFTFQVSEHLSSLFSNNMFNVGEDGLLTLVSLPSIKVLNLQNREQKHLAQGDLGEPNQDFFLTLGQIVEDELRTKYKKSYERFKSMIE